MHGRLKVRSTEEQEERKRLEREKKLQLYKGAMSACLAKLHARDFDRSGLALSGDILAQSCDVQTLWNFRKEIILATLASNQTNVEDEGENKDDKDKKIIDLFENELALTETCLRKNPKSYGSWYHRQWCVKKANELGLGEKSTFLSWSNELKLCSLFLKLDERNFHCWRHRFFVVAHGKLSKQDELAFTKEKIEENFSNYSAWHYRSKLIETLNNTETEELSTETFRGELELIENAAATDPNDQSAWIYEKWLLLKHKQCFLRDSELTRAHMKSLTDLLELEGGKSKWLILTLIDLMCLESGDLETKYKTTILNYLDMLANEIDLFRRNYYLDMKRKFSSS